MVGANRSKSNLIARSGIFGPGFNKYLSCILIHTSYLMDILKVANWPDCSVKKGPQNQDITADEASIIVLTDYAAGGFMLTLFQAIVKLRSYYVRLKRVDYGKVTFNMLKFVPPPWIQAQFRNDYDLTRAQMIFGQSPDFDTIIDELKQLTEIFSTSAKLNLSRNLANS